MSKGYDKIAVIGSRVYPRLDLVNKLIHTLHSQLISDLKDDIKLIPVIVSGGHPFSCPEGKAPHGVDFVAMQTAWAVGLNIIPIPAHWKMQGKQAGFIRNPMIADVADRCYAFYDGVSKGTAHTIKEFQSRGKPLTIFYADGTEVVDYEEDALPFGAWSED